MAEQTMEIIRLKNELTNEKATVARISRELKFEYQDFMGAEDSEMTVELGENMREQLKNIFRILEKEGIILKAERKE